VYRTRFTDTQLNFGSGSKINTDDIPEGTTNFYLTTGSQDILGSKTFKDGIYVDGDVNVGGNIYVNYDGPDEDSYLYFYEGGSSSGSYLKWDNTDNWFEFNKPVVASNVVSNGDVYINYDGPNGNSYLYFYDGNNPASKFLKWDNNNSRFEFNYDIYVTGNITSTQAVYGEIGGDTVASFSDLYANFNGPDGDAYLYFHKISPVGRYLKWANTTEKFVFNDDLTVSGSIQATGNLLSDGNIYINYGGPETHAYLYFYSYGSSTGQYLKWTHGLPDYFELSNELRVNGEMCCNGLRIEQEPKEGVLEPQEYFVIYLQGTKYRIPIQPD